MKCNENLKIMGSKVILVPYMEEHVPKYHEWMQSEELRQLTASEPLSLHEEYEMQQSWRQDDNKCTFILLDKVIYESGAGNEIESMVGDVNLFLNDDDNPLSAEIEIMIAEPSSRGKGLGHEALFTMMRYGFEDLKLTCYSAKIGYTNQPSIQMFSKIGFKEVSRSDVFQEITYELPVTEEVKNMIKKSTTDYTKVRYR